MHQLHSSWGSIILLISNEGVGEKESREAQTPLKSKDMKMNIFTRRGAEQFFLTEEPGRRWLRWNLPAFAQRKVKATSRKGIHSFISRHNCSSSQVRLSWEMMLRLVPQMQFYKDNEDQSAQDTNASCHMQDFLQAEHEVFHWTTSFMETLIMGLIDLFNFQTIGLKSSANRNSFTGNCVQETSFLESVFQKPLYWKLCQASNFLKRMYHSQTYQMPFLRL